MITVLDHNGSPVAVYKPATGVAGLITIKTSKSGSSSAGDSFKAAVLSISGDKAANVQLTANLDNKAYYVLFGERLGTYSVTCADLVRACPEGDAKNIKGFKDAVTVLSDAITRGNLPSVKISYAPTSSTKAVIITGYLTNIKFAMENPYKGYYTLIVQGYSR